MASVATASFSKRAFAAGFLALAAGLGGIGKSLKGVKKQHKRSGGEVKDNDVSLPPFIHPPASTISKSPKKMNTVAIAE